MRISDWSSDVCSSDLSSRIHLLTAGAGMAHRLSAKEEADNDAPRDSQSDLRRNRRAEGCRPGTGPAAQAAGAGTRGRCPVPSAGRSDERRVGKAWVSTFKIWWGPYT